jgi:phosphoglycolate phosphatase
MEPCAKRTLLIFDFDGTLANSFPVFAEALRTATHKFDLRPVNDDDVESLRRLGAREIIRYLGIPLWRVPAIGRFVHEAMSTAADEIRLFGGMEGLLRDLVNAGIGIAVVSSNSEENVRRVLGPELSKLIAAFECGASLFGKSMRFRRVLRRMAVAPREALSIGDEIRDAQASASVGLPFGAVSWGYTHADALMRSGSHYLFRTAGDILSVALGDPPMTGCIGASTDVNAAASSTL